MPPLSRAEKAEQLKKYVLDLRDLRQEFQERVTGLKCNLFDIKKCELSSYIGKGGFGKVYRAKKEGQDVAIKVQQKATFSEYHIQYVVREKNYLNAMDSVFICKMLAKWKDAAALYLYLELAVYGDLRRFMRELGIVDEERAVQYVSQIACALEYVHACGLLYRDLKPGNVLIFEGGRLKLGDFGLAIKGTPNINAFVGTHHYCAPEMYAGDHYTDAVDWWALGCCLYEMTMGKRPFSNATDPIEVVEENLKGEIPGLDESPLNDHGRDLLRKLLEKNPVKRIGTNVPGVGEIKQHPWFENIDFHDVVFGDAQIADLGLGPLEGKAVKEDFTKDSRPEEEDPDRHLWADF